MSAYTIAGLRADNAEWFAQHARFAAEHHEWPKGMPSGVRELIDRYAVVARSLTADAVQITSLLALHGVDGVSAPGIPYDEDADDIDDDESETWAQ